jgi:hypothetical protein
LNGEVKSTQASKPGEGIIRVAKEEDAYLLQITTELLMLYTRYHWFINNDLK